MESDVVMLISELLQERGCPSGATVRNCCGERGASSVISLMKAVIRKRGCSGVRDAKREL